MLVAVRSFCGELLGAEDGRFEGEGKVLGRKGGSVSYRRCYSGIELLRGRLSKWWRIEDES